jgi:DNA-binding beta-propeller fold protein YncE
MSSSNPHEIVSVGSGAWRYHCLARWQQLPPGWDLVEVAGVATDSRDRVHVFNRGQHPVIVFDGAGNFLTSWGEGLIRRAHGITIGPDDAVYCTDDLDHTVRKFTPEGKLLLTLGVSGQASDTGIDGIDYRTIRRAGPPFHRPTNVALAADGSLYVTDGYGNARVHQFAADGRLLHSWGEPGSGPGQFNLPHGIALDSAGRVYVADRENSRIQVFSPAGDFLAQWTDVARPMQVFIDRRDNVFVVDVGWRAGLFPWQSPPGPNPVGARLSVFNRAGELLARWGDAGSPSDVGSFFAPHDVCMDSHGDLYVGEVVMSAGGNRGLVPADCHALQKFVRQAPPSPEHAEPIHHGLLAWMEDVPRHLLHRAVGKVKQTYGVLEQRYGAGYARAILGAGLVALPVPVPGSSALAAAPLLAAAEVHRALAQSGAVGAASSAVVLTAEEIHSVGKRFLQELIHGFPRHAEEPGHFEALVHAREAALGRTLTDAEHRQLLADYLAQAEHA